MLHLTGVKGQFEVETQGTGGTLEDQALPAARQPYAGHPEYRWTSGVETTTGPWGKAWHQRGHGDCRPMARGKFNRPGYELFDYNVYVLCSDGGMMEGIAGEAASLAGHSKLPTCAGFTITTTSRSRAIRRWLTPTTWPHVSRARLERDSRWAMPTICRNARACLHDFQERERPADPDRRPTAISPTEHPRSRTPRRPWRSRWGRTKFADQAGYGWDPK